VTGRGVLLKKTYFFFWQYEDTTEHIPCTPDILGEAGLQREEVQVRPVPTGEHSCTRGYKEYLRMFLAIGSKMPLACSIPGCSSGEK
jgi:hypothetical protein